MYSQIQRVLILISDFIMSALNESILQILKCPVCYELITKLAHCSNGHSVCSKCCDRLKHCPMCRANLDKCSKCPINQIIEKLEFPCTFRENGCDAVLSSKNKEIHKIENHKADKLLKMGNPRKSRKMIKQKSKH